MLQVDNKALLVRLAKEEELHGSFGLQEAVSAQQVRYQKSSLQMPYRLHRLRRLVALSKGENYYSIHSSCCNNSDRIDTGHNKNSIGCRHHRLDRWLHFLRPK